MSIIANNKKLKTIPKYKLIYTLDLWNNKISIIPRLPITLTHLNLASNNLMYIPDSIGELVNLTQLYLAYNKIKRIPDNITNLTKLKRLTLCHNKLTCLPVNIGKLKLDYFSAGNNNLRTLPASMIFMQFNIYRNKIIIAPNCGIKKILTYDDV